MIIPRRVSFTSQETKKSQAFLSAVLHSCLHLCILLPFMIYLRRPGILTTSRRGLFASRARGCVLLILFPVKVATVTPKRPQVRKAPQKQVFLGPLHCRKKVRKLSLSQKCHGWHRMRHHVWSVFVPWPPRLENNDLRPCWQHVGKDSQDFANLCGGDPPQASSMKMVALLTQHFPQPLYKE